MPEPLPLHILTREIAQVVTQAFDTPIWVVAEVSEMHVANNGHCYLQLIEKDAKRGTTLASVRATIWANRWWLLRDAFFQQTGQQFNVGMKVMVCVQVNMHELYGLSLNIIDIDPTYTLGEMARRRLEIIRQLEQDGIIDMNRELPFPTLPQRIAIVSAEGAAGYGDFIKQLANNSYGLKFYHHLFPALLQGNQTESSVIEALERIDAVADLFDVVVIIRGGGATVDLASFDSYPLAQCIAQFPLPVITGIGHDRDMTVIDRVAHTSVKTPTAAAAFLIETMSAELERLDELKRSICDAARQYIDTRNQHLQNLANAIRGSHTRLLQKIGQLDLIAQKINLCTRQRLQRESDKLKYISQTIQMAQPDLILQRGFTITRIGQHAIKAASEVTPGATLTIQTAHGEVIANAIDIK